MNTLSLALLGGGVGFGLLVIRRGIAPRPAAIDKILADLARPGRPVDCPSDRPGRSQLAHHARRVLVAVGQDPARAHGQLELADRTPDQLALSKLAGAVGGLLIPVLFGVMLAAGGLALAPGAILALALACAVVGFVLPDLRLREEAEKRRRAFRFALSSYLDMVVVLLAGGAGIDSAIQAAAEAGDGWAYQKIRSELRLARLTGRNHWDAFRDVAERLGVKELAELSASISLAGSHGARVRATLATKADTLRGHQLAETEADAEAATERMTVPIGVLLLGFLVFLTYPAMASITMVTNGGPTP